MVNADLPCEIVAVVAPISGGGTNVVRDYVQRGYSLLPDATDAEHTSTEAQELVGKLRLDYYTPLRPIGFRPTCDILPVDLFGIAKWLRQKKLEALDRGQDKVVIKLIGAGIWTPEVFLPNQLGVTVTPVFAVRNPHKIMETTLSYCRRPTSKSVQWHIDRAAIEVEQMKKLAVQYGWQMVEA